MSARTWRKRNRRAPWVGTRTGAAPGENSAERPQEAKNRAAPRGSHPTAGSSPQDAAGDVPPVPQAAERGGSRRVHDGGRIKKSWDTHRILLGHQTEGHLAVSAPVGLAGACGAQQVSRRRTPCLHSTEEFKKTHEPRRKETEPSAADSESRRRTGSCGGRAGRGGGR